MPAAASKMGGVGRPGRTRWPFLTRTAALFAYPLMRHKWRSDLGSSTHQITIEAVGANSPVSLMASPATQRNPNALLKPRQDTLGGLGPQESEARERAAIRIQRVWRQKSRIKYLNPDSRWLDVSLHARLRVRRPRNSISHQADERKHTT